MGIPFYFKNIVKNHTHIVQQCSKLPQCQRLFFDFNCIVHQSANKVIAENASITQNETTLHNAIFDDVKSYMDKLISLVNPSSLVYIAVDGLCPRAKMQQQRKRRFLTQWKNEKLGIKHGWDSNCITPGTQFMSKLDNMLSEYVTKKNESTASINFILSGSNEFGEGEHKIFKYLSTQDTSKCDVIYGLDADLIMLSMISKCSDNIKLLRERPIFDVPIDSREEFLTLDINALKQSITEIYGCNPQDQASFINDYVMICSLLGNDFIPSLSFLKIKDNGIDMLLKAYSNSKAKFEDSTLVITSPDHNASINLQMLHDIIHQLSRNEDEMTAEVCENYYKRTVRYDHRRFKNAFERASFELDNYPTFNKFPQGLINPRIPGWRLSYYKHIFGTTESHDINRICDSYLQGLEWISKYYFTNEAPISWYYKYNYSPSILDLTNRIAAYLYDSSRYQEQITHAIPINEASFKTVLEHPTLQLLMVLPPRSRELVDTRYRPLMTHIEHGCLAYYPIGFKISTFLKSYLWECYPVLPDIDADILFDAYKKLA